MHLLLDPHGRPVRLTEERRAHILERQEMLALAGELARVLADPQHVVQSISDSSVNLFYRRYTATPVGDKWLCVVVKYRDVDAFVLTAYLTDRIKQGVPRWPLPRVT